MARSRSRNSTAKSDRRESNGDDSNSPKESQPESDSPLSFEYEIEDGLKVTLKPGEVELSREYELTENDLIEFSAGIDFSIADVEVKKKGLDLEASGEVSLPGNLLGVSAGIVIDLKTGEISGGELGVELGSVGIEVSAEGENGCQKAIKLSIGGIGISYVRDDCNDDDEDEDDDDNEIKKPVGGEPLTEEIVDDIMRRWREKGEPNQCQDIPLTYHTVWEDTPIESGWHDFYISFSKGGIWNGYASDAEENEMLVRGLWDDLVDHPEAGEIIYVSKGYEPSFNGCMAKLYDKKSKNQVILSAPPPMRDSKCCQETSELLQDIYDALNVDEILSKGVKTPNRLIAYGASKQTTHKDYLSLIAFLIREIDHLGIHPFEVNISDTNPALEGDQSVSLEFVNATAVAKQLIELSLENKGDSAARLNLQVRSARIQVQILNAVVVISRMVQGLINYVGMPIREIVDQVTMPFDITLGNRRKFSGKGFGSGKKPDLIQEINKNTEQATEEILDKFLKEEKQPVVSETYDANEPGLLELIQRFIKR